MSLPQPLPGMANVGCFMPACKQAVLHGHIMCRPHWRMVPGKLAQAVYEAFCAWRRNRARADLRATWLRAAAAARDAVIAREAELE